MKQGERDGDDPCLHAEQIIQAVVIEREMPEMREVQRHQADDRLIGIEEEAFENGGDPAANDDQQHRDRCKNDSLATHCAVF